ncbi:hypothetical protein LEM8419_02688 [Neolewinella maritima]|uniref:Phosphatidic acid phosphatase type 2/haloperoxidase domain-containing protein n=1 Tax=Neolewinella maritima TaxID=1383882 RepID=A0ABN8F891_9BACT|nr:phosphatase PAP2 family protein [Neolewinella maritima]CAH1001782.1 hypothetical protein LEM8419_02688 [Neolewinella maritima]
MLSVRNLFIFVLLLLTLGVGAQEFPYALEWKREVSLLSLGGGLSVGSHLLESRIRPLTLDQLVGQRRHKVWFLDRGATRNECDVARVLSDELLRGAMLLPATLAISRRGRRKGLVLATMLAQTMLLNDGFTKMTKVLIRRDRPLTFNEQVDSGAKMGSDARQSFVSGHTSNAAALSFFTAKVFHDLYPDSPWRPAIWAGAAIVPLATGYARYRAGKHFPTDIAAGYALGAALGILIPQWHKSPTQPGWSVGMAGDGLGLSLRW